MSNRPLKSLLLVILFLALSGGHARAQWIDLGDKTSGDKSIMSMFFFNELHGYIGVQGPVGLEIMRTTDGGKSWLSSKLELSENSTNVSDIFMVDQLNGWATTDANYVDTSKGILNRGLYQTTDGGLTWKLRPVLNAATSVIQIGQKVFVTSRRDFVKMFVSQDGGKTFSETTYPYLNDVQFTDPLHGVASKFETGDWIRTTDGGVSWSILPKTLPESWSLYGVAGTSRFYATPEHDPGNRPKTSGTNVLRSLDYGAAWQTITVLPFYSTGHLAGKDDLLYLQQEDTATGKINMPGLFRSSDRGATWKNVGGKAALRDSRFAVTGCNGGVVYASDYKGNLYKTTNGGDGSIVEPPFTLEFGDDTIRIATNVCDEMSVRFKFRNLYCSPDSIISITLDPSDATTSGALSLTDVPALPQIYKTDEGDDFGVKWDPSKVVHVDTTIFVRVRMKYYSTATHTLIDTSIVIAARAQGAAPTASLPSEVAMGDLPSCSPSDSLFVITNTSCDTLYLNAPSVTGATGLTLQDEKGNAIAYPIAIPPGKSDTIHVEINSTKAGAFAYVLTFPALHQKIAGSFSTSIRGTIVVTDPQFAVSFDSLLSMDSALLDRGKMTRCDPPQEFYLYIRNPGCTEVALRNVMFEGDGKVFTVTPDGVLPDTLTGEDVHRIKITVDPSQLGVTTDRLRVRYKIGSDPSIDLFYPFTVDVGYGTRLLALEQDLRDLDTIEYCQTRDSVIRFQNTGCDTLTLTGAAINGADYRLFPRGVLPRKIAPGAFDSVIVQYDPLLPGDALGHVQFTSDADSIPIRDIDLRAYALPTDTVTFRLVPERDIVNSNDTLNFNLFPDTTIRGKGLRSLSMILSYNGDVLTFMSAKPLVPGLTILPPIELEAGLKARQLSLTLLHASDITIDSLISLISLRFRTTLSDSTYATMNLSDFVVNQGDPKFAKCVLGSRAKEASLTLALFCGDSTIKQTLLLNKLVLSANAPWPSPASHSRTSEVRIPYVLNASTQLTLRVYSLEGVLAFESSDERSVGRGEFAIPMDRLPSGSYHYTITCEGTQVRGLFIVAE